MKTKQVRPIARPLILINEKMLFFLKFLTADLK
jgi:hypothetical protein